MTITPQYKFVEGIGAVIGYRAEQKIENGLLSFVEVAYGNTRMEAITKMFNRILKIYGLSNNRKMS